MITFNTPMRSFVMAAVLALAVGGAGCASDEPGSPPVTGDRVSHVQGTVDLQKAAAASKILTATGAIDASAEYANSVVAFKVNASGKLEAVAKGTLAVDGTFSFEANVDLYGAILVAFDASGKITVSATCGYGVGGEGGYDFNFTATLDLEASVEVAVLLDLKLDLDVDVEIDIEALCAHIDATIALAVSLSVDIGIEIDLLAKAFAKAQGFELNP